MDGVTATTVTGEGETVATRTEAAIDISTARRRGGRPPRGNGRGGGGGPGGGGPGGPGGDGGNERRSWTPERYRIGVYVGIASILMMFTALASALIVRAGLPSSIDWRGGHLPSFVYLSTALIVASSLTFMRAKSSLARGRDAQYRLWLGVTLALGLGFMAGQILAWRQLVERGVYLASNPYSSFFYVLTGLHGLHLLGGIIALSFLFAYARRSGPPGEEAGAKRRTLTEVVGVYWHFMDALWVFLLLLLFIWR